MAADESPFMRHVFAALFPFGPGWNSGEQTGDTYLSWNKQ
jgi:hypothetical protein